MDKLFIAIMSFFISLTFLITITGLPRTGYFVKNACEPMNCELRGLEPSGNYYCDESMCYRDCYQGDVLIKMATFCDKNE